MDTPRITPPDPVHATYWQVPPVTATHDELLPRLRVRLVAVVAAMLIQGVIAILGVLPDLPGRTAESSYVSHSGGFWAQFAAIEFLAAVVVSFAFGPVVHLRDIPVVGRFVLGLAFVGVPAVAVVLGAADAWARAAAEGSTIAASNLLATAFFVTLFFGLPLIALVGREPRPAA